MSCPHRYRSRPKAREFAANVSQGLKTTVFQSLPENAEIMVAYEAYCICRLRQVATFTVAKKDKEVLKVIPFTQGLSFMPYPGSIDDQPYRLMIFFDKFIEGDAVGFNKNVSK